MNPILSLSPLVESLPLDAIPAWFLRITLVATLATAFLLVARRALPATRHMVAVAGLAAVAVVPLASALLPTLNVRVLPAPAPVESVWTAPAPHYDATTARIPHAAPAPAPIDRAEPTAGTVTAEAPGRFAAINWSLLAIILWAAVAAALLIQIGVGAVRAHRFARRSTAVSDARVQREFARACDALGIDCDADLTTSWDVAVPVVVGVRRPRVIVPTSASAWSDGRLRVVFLHELAHARRFDAAWLLFARCVTAVLWFHPLVWVMAGAVRREAERACDDVVLATGVRGSDYAAHLVSLARSISLPAAAPALAFATPSSLERRVASILSGRRPGACVSPATLAALAVAGVLAIGSISVLRPTRAESAVKEMPRTFNTKHFERDFARDFKQSFRYDLKENTVYQAGNSERSKERREGEEAYDRASELYNDERWARAAESYMKAARAGYRSDTAYYNAGCSYALANKPGEAIDALRSAIDEGFDDPDHYGSDTDLNSLRADPRFKSLMDELMKSDGGQRKLNSANRRFDQLSKRSSVDNGEWNQVGIALMRSGNFERAYTAFDNEYKVSKDSDAIYNKACAYSLAGQKATAMKLLDQAIKTSQVDADHMAEDPDLIPLHDQAGFDGLVALAEDLTLWDNGNWGGFNWKSDSSWRKRLPHFEKVASDRSDVGRAWFNLGYAQLAAEMPEKGTVSFQKALDLGYQPGTTMYNLACCAAQSGDNDKAIDWLTRAEKSGMNMSSARWDDDLSPLRSDKRFKEMRKKWKKDDEHEWHWDDNAGHDDHSHDDDDRDDTN